MPISQTFVGTFRYETIISDSVSQVPVIRRLEAFFIPETSGQVRISAAGLLENEGDVRWVFEVELRAALLGQTQSTENFLSLRLVDFAPTLHDSDSIFVAHDLSEAFESRGRMRLEWNGHSLTTDLNVDTVEPYHFRLDFSDNRYRDFISNFPDTIGATYQITVTVFLEEYRLSADFSSSVGGATALDVVPMPVRLGADFSAAIAGTSALFVEDLSLTQYIANVRWSRLSDIFSNPSQEGVLGQFFNENNIQGVPPNEYFLILPTDTALIIDLVVLSDSATLHINRSLFSQSRVDLSENFEQNATFQIGTDGPRSGPLGDSAEPYEWEIGSEFEEYVLAALGDASSVILPVTFDLQTYSRVRADFTAAVGGTTELLVIHLDFAADFREAVGGTTALAVVEPMPARLGVDFREAVGGTTALEIVPRDRLAEPSIRRVVDSRGLTGPEEVYALEIMHPDLSDPIRVVADNANHQIDGETYTPLAFQVVAPQEVEGEVRSAQLRIDNVGRELMALIHASRGARNATMRVMRIVRAHELDIGDAHVSWEATMDVGIAEVTNQYVGLTLTDEPVIGRPSVVIRHDPGTSPGLF